MDTLKAVKEFGIRAKGQAERIKCLQGEPLTRGDAMLAHCYDCTGGYADGAMDCDIKTCSMYKFMPYRKDKMKLKRERSEKQILNDRKLPLLRPTGHTLIDVEKFNHPDTDINLDGERRTSAKE